ncbi:hypothetical protein AB0953_16555 [Streptomyces sp. NPDC046866]|uniref:hypothetical protein n=1 Tax=Streptomyces sp. NPDC046866 TaxID=3154921 RepID=UPI0034528A87
MGVRFGVMGDTERECAEGLALLAGLGVRLVVTQPPVLLAGDRWIARAVHMPAAPTGEGQGREG